MSATIHASAVLLGRHALLIRGPAGSGKSRLALALLEAGTAGRIRFVQLVADDRAEIEACHGRLLVRPPPQIRGLIEIRGLGIRRTPFEPLAVVGLVADLAAEDSKRMPAPGASAAMLEGISLPRLAIPPGADPLALILAACWLPAAEVDA